MSRGVGHIQRRILTILETIEDRYITRDNKPMRWVWMNILIIKVYHPQQISANKKDDWNWGCSKNEHRRVWESCRSLETRGLINIRIIEAKEIGLRPRFGGCTRWMEVRLK